MRSALCSTVAITILGLTAALGRARARVLMLRRPSPSRWRFWISTMSTRPASRPIKRRLINGAPPNFVSALQRDLAANGQYRVVPMSCGSGPCEPVMNPAELQKAARAAGARFVLLGGVHKMSTLVQWAKIQVADEEQGRIVFDRLLTFRGDTDEAWQRAESFVARDVLNLAPTFGKQGDALAPVKLAVFDFELEDFSGGAGIIPKAIRTASN